MLGRWSKTLAFLFSSFFSFLFYLFLFFSLEVEPKTPRGFRCSHGHLGGTVGGVALLPGVGVVGRLRWGVLHLHVLPLAHASSPHASVYPPVRHAEDIVFNALLPLANVAVPPARAVHGGGGAGRGVSRGRGLPVDVACGRLPGFEGRGGEQRVCGGFRQAQVFQLAVAARDGDGERGVEVVEVVVHRHGLVDVGLLSRLHRHRLEGRSCHVLVLGEVHEREALVVAPGRTVCCKKGRMIRIFVSF